jgi:hypothetical protein
VGSGAMRPSRRFLLECVVIAMILAAGTIAFGVWRFHWPERSHAHGGTRVGEESRQPEKLTVSLRAQTRKMKSGRMIHVQWDPSAKPIRRSPYGILYIYDRGVPNNLVLQRRALDSGSTEYQPDSDEITFHLILPGGRSEGESLMVLLGTPARPSGSSGR